MTAPALTKVSVSPGRGFDPSRLHAWENRLRAYLNGVQERVAALELDRPVARSRISTNGSGGVSIAPGGRGVLGVALENSNNDLRVTFEPQPTTNYSVFVSVSRFGWVVQEAIANRALGSTTFALVRAEGGSAGTQSSWGTNTLDIEVLVLPEVAL